MNKARENALLRRIDALREALEFYGNPETYHAISVIADRPAGEFADDFSRNHGHWNYDRAMPGKLARKAIATDARKHRQQYKLPESEGAE